MLSRWGYIVISTAECRARRVGQAIKSRLRPARTAAVLVGAVAVDAMRPRSHLVAENALFRQQILVLRRTARRRPHLHREDRLILVLPARVHRAWRDALHLVQPDTVLRWPRDWFTLLWRRTSRRRNEPGWVRTSST